VRKNRFFEVSLASSEGEELSAAELQVCVGAFAGRVLG